MTRETPLSGRARPEHLRPPRERDETGVTRYVYAGPEEIGRRIVLKSRSAITFAATLIITVDNGIVREERRSAISWEGACPWVEPPAEEILTEDHLVFTGTPREIEGYLAVRCTGLVRDGWDGPAIERIAR
ncbi:hypothetical protein [Streptosporangium sp. NBC_01469]|uniref:hypothetical protein n=1 Tax=Streptosporangium sp. NBC_01469 TaxID=2903898 RepID=UPI002E2856D7|nr:hypothetical protein [Streptosporangium sp. NBC_01469]